MEESSNDVKYPRIASLSIFALQVGLRDQPQLADWTVLELTPTVLIELAHINLRQTNVEPT